MGKTLSEVSGSGPQRVEVHLFGAVAEAAWLQSGATSLIGVRRGRPNRAFSSDKDLATHRSKGHLLMSRNPGRRPCSENLPLDCPADGANTRLMHLVICVRKTCDFRTAGLRRQRREGCAETVMPPALARR